MMKILITDKLAQEGIDVLKTIKEFQVDVKTGLKPEELKSVIKDYDALIVRSETQVTADILEKAERLKIIGRAGVGLDNVDLKAATKKGVVAMNTPSGNTTSTAEHTMSLILALSRNIPSACASLKSGKWERSKFTGVEFHQDFLADHGGGLMASGLLQADFGIRVTRCFRNDQTDGGEDAAIFRINRNLEIARGAGIAFERGSNNSILDGFDHRGFIDAFFLLVVFQ